MKKVIAFSLWGNDTRYTHGALENIELAKEVYPDWVCRFYMGKDTSVEIVEQMAENDNVEIIKMGEKCDWTGMFWRFYAACDPTVDVMISRDCDSRLWYREKNAVDEWIQSPHMFHIMRDHPYHNVPILGGMWGAKKGCLPNIQNAIQSIEKGDYWQVDQEFLTRYEYPVVKDKSMVHDEFFEKKSFHCKRDPKHFVGQAYAGNGRILDAEEYFHQFTERYRNEYLR